MPNVDVLYEYSNPRSIDLIIDQCYEVNTVIIMCQTWFRLQEQKSDKNAMDGEGYLQICIFNDHFSRAL